MSSSPSHVFDTHIASKYGMKEAVLIKHFQFWIDANTRKKNGIRDSFREGRWWTYQTLDDIASHYQYLSKRQVEKAINSLVKKEVLIKGNFNKTKFDRTVWYAFKDEGLYLNTDSQVVESHDITERRNPNHQKVTPIPYTKTDTKKDILSEIGISDDTSVSSKQKKSSKVKISPEAMSLSQDLYDSIISWKGKLSKSATPTKWGADIDKLMRIDGFTAEEIKDVIEWLPRAPDKNSFCWRDNILSGAKLRKQFDKLHVAYKKDNPTEEEALRELLGGV